MKAKFWNKGEVISYLNVTEYTIEDGDLVVLGNRVGIAGCPIYPNESGSVHVTGIWELKNNSFENIDVGEIVYWGNSGITKTETTVKVGWCVKLSSDSEKIFVKID